jgi:glutamate dehydrogenase (NAD(P)+)
MDTYSMHARHTVTSVVTGKPLSLGGSRGRVEATEARPHVDLPRGGAAARPDTRRKPHRRPGLRQRRLDRSADVPRAGAKVIAVSDIQGGIVDRPESICRR